MNRIKISFFLLFAVGGSIAFDFSIHYSKISSSEITDNFLFSNLDLKPLSEGIRSTFFLETLESTERAGEIGNIDFVNTNNLNIQSSKIEVLIILQDNPKHLFTKSDFEIIFSRMLV